MHRTIRIALATILFVCSLPLAAQDRGYWRATSSNADKITGDIAISEARLTINFIGFSLAPIKKLTTAEAAAAFDVDVNVPGAGSLYRLNIPADKRFLHKNTLCGSEVTQWMVTYVEGRTLHVAFFSGNDMPLLTAEALTNSTDVCGLFSYSH
ncbi:MAG TPA: hypothetical protein VGF82_11825 [Terracidiphilus sp.]|jgi:hypothetical protein